MDFSHHPIVHLPLPVSSGICPVYVLGSRCFNSCLGIYLPFNTSVLEIYFSSATPSPQTIFFSPFLQRPSWQTGKQTASHGPVLFLRVASSGRAQHGYTHGDTQTCTSPAPCAPRGVLLTQIQTHQSLPLWNDSGASQVKIRQTARDTHTHTCTHACTDTHTHG